MTRLLMMLLGMWVGIGLVMLALARLNNHPVVIPQILAESFYYSAIAIAVYHMINKRRQTHRNDAATNSGADEPTPQKEDESVSQ